MKPTVKPGIVAVSKKGRDKSRVFVVLSSVDADFVMVCDGDTRKLDHLKKKSVKHLRALPAEMPELLALHEKRQLKDSDVRKALAPYTASATGRTGEGNPPDIKGGSSFVEK